MNKSEIYAFLNANPVFHLATAEGDNPHVRAMRLYRADENGIVFETGIMKDLYKQLSENPKVELCFNNYQDNVQIRVSGAVEIVEDDELKKEILAKRKYLRPLTGEAGYTSLAVYCLKNGVATVWTRGTTLAPKSYISL